MTLPRVIVTDPEFVDAARVVGAEFPDIELEVPTDAAGLMNAAASAAALITQGARVDATLLEHARNLRLLIKMGRVYDHIDLEAVRTRGVPFGLVPRHGPNCVAETALTLILALSKDLIIAHRAVADGAYRLRGVRPVLTSERVMSFSWMKHVQLHEVRGKTLGCVGFGEIGCELSRRARVMGMRVLYTRRTPLPPGLEALYGVSYRSLDALCEECDYVSVAVPHTKETTNLIGPDQLQRLGPTSYLVNVARGGVVDEEALIQALRERVIAGAALDVFTYEPLPADSPLCQLDNVILTPHIGGGTGTSHALELRQTLTEVRTGLREGLLREQVIV